MSSLQTRQIELGPQATRGLIRHHRLLQLGKESAHNLVIAISKENLLHLSIGGLLESFGAIYRVRKKGAESSSGFFEML